MDRLITLRTELESEIQRQGYSLSSFSKASGINRGILSATLNGNPPKPMSINQLDGMVKALGKPEGWLYELFVEECFNESGKTNWRRVRPLLLRCVDLHQVDLIRRTLDLLMEDSAHVSHVFDVAEELVAQERGKDAVPLYQCVIENERNYQSERLAVSQYRLFRAALGHNIEDNLKAALIFESFRNRLPAHLKLDALLKLGNVYYTVQDWNNVIKFGDELVTLSTFIYREKNIKRRKTIIALLSRPLVRYYAYGHLIQFTAYEHTACYDKARSHLKHFADLSWFEDLDDEGLKQVKLFKYYAQFNALNLDLLSGNMEKLPDYLTLMTQHPEETLPCIFIIIKSANFHNTNIDHILNKYENIIYPPDLLQAIGELQPDYNPHLDVPVDISRYINMYYQLALYQCNKEVYDEQLERVLLALEYSVEKYNRGRILDCLELFKKLRNLKY